MHAILSQEADADIQEIVCWRALSNVIAVAYTFYVVTRRYDFDG